jgi:hypothetical protein
MLVAFPQGYNETQVPLDELVTQSALGAFISCSSGGEQSGTDGADVVSCQRCEPLVTEPAR